MSALLYREDMDEVRRRLTAWWHGEDIGRPAMMITVPRPEPLEDIPALPRPEGWTTRYSTGNFEYRLNLAARRCINTIYMGEAVPVESPDLGANCLALYLGCTAVDGIDTVWFEPCIDELEEARFEVDRENFYWDFTLRLAREEMKLARGKFMLAFPDLIEGLDTLAAMRGTERLLTDLIDRPEWVRDCMRRITDCYFYYYDVLYDMFRDEVGGCHWWIWGPGRTVKLQCDFSAMISPAMFAEFMVPVLIEMCERTSYPFYHWDGPGAIPHHDHLLSIERLRCLQWTPGAGARPCADPTWWPLYHKTIEAGKNVFIGIAGLEQLQALKREFGAELQRFILSMNARTVDEADELLRAAEL